jgi:hypothetical protein
MKFLKYSIYHPLPHVPFSAITSGPKNGFLRPLLKTMSRYSKNLECMRDAIILDPLSKAARENVVFVWKTLYHRKI